MRKTSLDTVFELGKKDPRVVFIGSDLGVGTLKEMKAALPERFYMEGISEANIVGMAAGMALEGKIPYVNTMSTFLTRRACEQLILDMCLHRTNVRLLGNGGGLVYAPLGPTHMAIDDIAIARSMPHMTVIAPADAPEMRRLVLQSLDYPGPVYFRVAKGGDPLVSREDLPCEIGKAVRMRAGKDALIITTGITLKIALDAAEQLAAQKGIDAGILHLHTLKPLDTSAVLSAIADVNAVVTIEEHTLMGGLGSIIAEVIAEAGFSPSKRFKRLGIPDIFPDEYGSQATLLKRFKLTPETLAHTVASLLEH